MNHNSTIDAQLRDLWQRRGDLAYAEQIRLYEIVTSVLQTCKPAILGSLPEKHDDYIQHFFVDKVVLLDTLTRCDHSGALCSFFRNYLTDQYRALQRQNQISLSETLSGTGDEEDRSISLIDQQAVVISDSAQIKQALDEAGLQPDAVASAAASWLSGSEDWTRLVMAYSFCPDNPQRVAISKLAERYAIKSAAHKVKKLGINWKGDAYQEFGNTLLGKWVRSFDVAIVPENMPLIHGVLKILCFEALSWAEQQRNFQ